MTRIIQAKYKKDLRYGVNIWGHNKSPINKKQRLPGMHGHNQIIKLSNYKIQLQERQRVKTYYNITEKQFRILFRKSKGNFINLLERRLMSFVYRLGIAKTIFSARQAVSHKHILVNGKKINIPSYSVKNSDVIKVTDRGLQFLNVPEVSSIPSYIEYDDKNKTYKFVRDPILSDIPFAFKIQAQHIIEYYSRIV